MPTLDIEVMLDCASNYGIFLVPSLSGPDVIYTVSFNGSEGPAFCDCPAYKFSRDQHCKHIDMAWKGACMMNPQWCDGHQPVQFRPVAFTYDLTAQDSECPNCGGPMVYVRRAV